MGYLSCLFLTVLINSWIIGFIGYGAGGAIHVLLPIAFFLILFSVFKDRERFKASSAESGQ